MIKNVLPCATHVHREYRPKANVTFVENGTMVSAFNPKTFVFLPKESVGDPAKDIITTINIPNVVSYPRSHPVVNGVCVHPTPNIRG